MYIDIQLRASKVFGMSRGLQPRMVYQSVHSTRLHDHMTHLITETRSIKIKLIKGVEVGVKYLIVQPRAQRDEAESSLVFVSPSGSRYVVQDR